MYTLLQRAAFKISAELRQIISHFHTSIFKVLLIFPKRCLKFTSVDEHSPEFQHVLRERPKSVRDFLKFPEISQRKLSNFSEKYFPKVSLKKLAKS